MKKILFFIAALSIWCIASAQEGQPLLLSIDKENGQYHKGETAQVFAALSGAEDAAFDILVTANGKTFKKENGKVLKAGEKVKLFDFNFDTPTALMVSASPSGSKDNSWEAKLKNPAVGMIFEAEGFRPGFNAPADLEQFWKKQVAALRKCKMKGKLTPVESNNSEVESFDMEVNMPEGRDVRGYLSMPKNRSPKSLPIIISLHGAGVRSSSLGTTVNWAKQGFISIDMNAHGILNGQPSSYYNDLSNGELKNYRHEKVVDHKSFYFRLMFLRIQRALDYATSLKEWDGKHIVAVGGSQGGLQTIAISAIDQRVTAAFPQVPAFTDLAGFINDHRNSWPGYGRDVEKSAEGSPERTILPYYDAACLATLVKCPIYFEAGLIDTTCPAECVFSAYNVTGSADKTIRTFPWRRHGTKDMAPDIKKLWTESIDKDRTNTIKESVK